MEDGFDDIFDQIDADAPPATDDGTGSLSDAAAPDGGPTDADGEQVAPGADPAKASAVEGSPDEPTDAPVDEPPTTKVELDAAEVEELRQSKAVLSQLREAAAARQQEVAEQAKRDEWKAAFEALPDLDERQLPIAANALYNDIANHVAGTFQAHIDAADEQIGMYQTGMAALVTAIGEVLPPEMQTKLEKAAAAYRSHGTLEAMQHQASLAKQLTQQTQATTAALTARITALEGELTAQRRLASGADRAEATSALGGALGSTPSGYGSGFDDLLPSI